MTDRTARNIAIALWAIVFPFLVAAAVYSVSETVDDRSVCLNETR